MKKLNSGLVWELVPTAQNARNSEGAFLRAPDGAILFAYSRGGEEDGCCLCRLGIRKIAKEDL